MTVIDEKILLSGWKMAKKSKVNSRDKDTKMERDTNETYAFLSAMEAANRSYIWAPEAEVLTK